MLSFSFKITNKQHYYISYEKQAYYEKKHI